MERWEAEKLPPDKRLYTRMSIAKYCTLEWFFKERYDAFPNNPIYKITVYYTNSKLFLAVGVVNLKLLSFKLTFLQLGLIHEC